MTADSPAVRFASLRDALLASAEAAVERMDDRERDIAEADEAGEPGIDDLVESARMEEVVCALLVQAASAADARAEDSGP